MALEDFVDPEVGIAVAATAAVMSPRVRGVLRQGAVYGLAALMKAGDSLGSAARGVAEGAQSTMSQGAAAAQDTVTEARATSRSRGSRNSGTAGGSPGE